mgnify:CR=1 FL=1
MINDSKSELIILKFYTICQCNYFFYFSLVSDDVSCAYMCVNEIYVKNAIKRIAASLRRSSTQEIEQKKREKNLAQFQFSHKKIDLLVTITLVPLFNVIGIEISLSFCNECANYRLCTAGRLPTIKSTHIIYVKFEVTSLGARIYAHNGDD